MPFNQKQNLTAKILSETSSQIIGTYLVIPDLHLLPLGFLEYKATLSQEEGGALQSPIITPRLIMHRG